MTSPTAWTDLAGPETTSSRLKSGAQFVLDDPCELDPVWGAGDEVLWASGEPLLIVGPTGVGKTTLAVQVVAARLGIVGEVLGWPVKPTDKPVLYSPWTDPDRSAGPCGVCSTRSTGICSPSGWSCGRARCRSTSDGCPSSSSTP